jgi:hypothetical protein
MGEDALIDASLSNDGTNSTLNKNGLNYFWKCPDYF